MYYEVTIRPAAGGFGAYEVRPINGDGWESESDLVSEMCDGRDLDDVRLVEIPSEDATAMAIERPTIYLSAAVPALHKLFAVVSDEDGADEVVGYVGIAGMNE